MLGRLQDLIIRTSRTWWLFLLVVILMIASLNGLLAIGEAFPPHAGGYPPFDLQNEFTPGKVLTAERVYPQIAGYTPRARALYGWFTAIDYVFPFVAGLFIAATAAFALRHGLPGVYATLAKRRLLPLFMLGSAFDWVENIAALTAISLWPAEIGGVPELLVLAKRLKLGCTLLAQAVTVLLLVAALWRWLRRRREAVSPVGEG